MHQDQVAKKDDTLVLGMDKQSLDYTMAACCRPIPGDDVFGFVTVSGGIKIHRSACPNSTQLLSKYGYRVLKARWAGQTEVSAESMATATIQLFWSGRHRPCQPHYRHHFSGHDGGHAQGEF